MNILIQNVLNTKTIFKINCQKIITHNLHFHLDFQKRYTYVHTHLYKWRYLFLYKLTSTAFSYLILPPHMYYIRIHCAYCFIFFYLIISDVEFLFYNYFVCSIFKEIIIYVFASVFWNNHIFLIDLVNI